MPEGQCRIEEVSADAATWEIVEGLYEDTPIVVRYNSGYRDTSDRSAWPYQIGVTVPLGNAGPDGFPLEPELEELSLVEDVLADSLRGGPPAVLVGVISTRGMREFVLYTRDPAWVEPWAGSLSERIETHDVQVMIQPDPEWDVYEAFASGE